MKRIIAFRQNGFTMISAIFILVVLGALGAFIVNISTIQQITSAQDLLGAKAYQAARAGIEWGIYQVLDPTNVSVVVPTNASWPNMPPCPGNPTSLMLEGFIVSVTCTISMTYNENGSARSIVIYSIGATAISGKPGSQGYIERQLQATISKCRTTDGEAPSYGCS